MDLLCDLLRVVAGLVVDAPAHHAHEEVGGDVVGQHDRRHRQGGDAQNQGAPPVHPAKEDRVDDLDNEDAGRSEQEQIADPDAAVEVHGLLAIVPPAGVEALFHVPGGEILQSAAQHHAGQEGLPHGTLPGDEASHHQGHGDGAPAVDGAVGPDEEATVDEAVELDVLQGHLGEPTQAGKEKKLKDEFTNQVQIQDSASF